MIIALDESGTHDSQYLVIGALFLQNPHAVLADLCAVKDAYRYFNVDPRKKAQYKEVHCASIFTQKDRDVAKGWIDVFRKHQCWYRSIVIDWSIWDGSRFGGPFEPDSLKKRRAYKKWAEMLLHPEVQGVRLAWLKLDHLALVQKYDVIKHLEDRFTRGYAGQSPRISRFSKVASWKDGNQDVQLSDLLTGCVFNSLVPPAGRRGRKKIEVREYLFQVLKKNFGVETHEASYWRGYAKSSLRRHFPKFSLWFWRPGE